MDVIIDILFGFSKYFACIQLSQERLNMDKTVYLYIKTEYHLKSDITPQKIIYDLQNDQLQ